MAAVVCRVRPPPRQCAHGCALSPPSLSSSVLGHAPCSGRFLNSRIRTAKIQTRGHLSGAPGKDRPAMLGVGRGCPSSAFRSLDLSAGAGTAESSEPSPWRPEIDAPSARLLTVRRDATATSS
jgi:hypothetical protein